jgi:chitinase
MIRSRACLFSFASTTTPDVGTLYLSDSDKSTLSSFVSTAHKNGVNASLSLGGWGGSQYFSSAVATPENRTAFTQAILNLVSTYDLDGIDFECVFIQWSL